MASPVHKSQKETSSAQAADRSALSADDILALAVDDLPIAQWYDTMKWWVDDHPERVLLPGSRWTITRRARELAELVR